eukprot:gene16930-18637_t
MKLLDVIDFERFSDDSYEQEEESATSSYNITIVDTANSAVKKPQHAELFAFFLLSFLTGLIVFEFSSLTPLSKQFGIAREGIELLSLVYFGVHALFGLFISFLGKIFGFQTVFVTTCIIYITGQIMTAVGLGIHKSSRSLCLVILGEITNAIGFALFIESPWSLVELTKKARKATIETVFFVAIFLGIATTLIAKASLAQDGYMVAAVLQKIVLSKAAMALLVLLVVVPFFCKQPSTVELYPDLLGTPPRSDHTFKQFFTLIQVHYMDFDFLLVTQAYAINFAITATQFTILHTVIRQELHQSNATAYWIHLSLAVGAIMGLLSGIFSSTRGLSLKLIGAVTMLISALNTAAFTFCLTSLKHTLLSIVFLAAWGMMSGAWLANGILQAREVSRLPAVDIPHSACLTTSSLYTAILICICAWAATTFGFIIVGYFWSGLYVLAFILIVLSENTCN